ncbi:hypothetical protein M9H77_22064 [Catharanthus roseus]|uniref:Uncharacterized protein n=1 Tax=Catharanthus roseus TaxID=4058 RepID=A0ACC0APT7_CATRO|nr:hypothetical protein M9H77_22064 [Catharanthus roseus]
MTITLHDVELILGVPAYGLVVDSRLSREQLLRLVQDDMGLALTGGLGFNVAELHAVATRLNAIYSTSWVADSSVIRVATLFLPDYGHCCRLRVLLGGVDISVLSDPYIQQFPMLGYKNGNKLLDIRLRLDVMTADEVRWVPYKMQEIWACWVSTWHDFIAYFDCVEPYMPDRILRQFGHLRIQNPGNIHSGFRLPVAPVMPSQALFDLIAREASREDLQDNELGCTVRDLLRKHYRAP